MNRTIRLQNGNWLRVDCVTPSVFRLRLNTTNAFEDGPLVRYGIVRVDHGPCAVSESETTMAVSFATGQTTLSVSLEDGTPSLHSGGSSLLAGAEAPRSSKEEGFDLSFRLSADERLYGFGDATRADIQKRGTQNNIIIMNNSAYAPIPFVMSTRGWGLFLNTTRYHWYDAGKAHTDVLRFHSEKGLLDCFLIAGTSLPAILANYTDLTGKPHLLPKWGYGLTFVCDERGVRARDILYEAYEFRRHDIPCDTIGLEPDWMETHYDMTVDKDWSKERFHIPFWLKAKDRKQQGTFNDALARMKFKLSLWLCCNYDFSEFEEMQLADGHLADDGPKTIEAGLFQDPHFAKSSIRIDQVTKRGEPWFEHLKKFVDDGASAFKLDGCEQVCFHPDRKWYNGMDDNEMHNLYPILYNKQMSLGFKAYTGRRAMIFSAGGYAGIQQYSATWAGDTGGDRNTLVSLLNHGLSGHSNVCTDMEVWTREGIHFGFFQALSQVLGWHMYNEPWFLGEELAAMFRSYCRLRYRLMPYIYSCAHVAARSALPVMRAMPLAFPEDLKCDEFIHQYLFGDFFLVSAFAERVYLPRGDWIDYWTGARIAGGRVVPAEFPQDRGGPLFVRAGAIIPTQATKGSIGTDTPEEIVWEVFPGADADFTLYEDDGESYAYLDGKIASTCIEMRDAGDVIRITIRPRQGSYANMPERRLHAVKIISTELLVLQTPGFRMAEVAGEQAFTIERIEERSDKPINLILKRKGRQ